MKNIDVIIPIFNEGETLKKIIIELNEKVKAKLNFIICYDHNDEPGLKYLPSLKNIRTVINSGKSPNTAILSGIMNSSSEFILVYMADDLENIDLINKFSNAEIAQIKKRKMQKADILKTHGNNYLVTKITNFKNFTKVERAIKNTSDWFRLNYKKLNFAK